MKELLDKLSSYNIFNYLFPGILFVVFAEQFTSYIFIKEDIFEGLITYYFVGLVISRFGSVVIECILKKSKFVKFAKYSDFVKACKKDEKISLLSEQNNMYRTLISMFIFLLLLKGYELLSVKLTFLNQWGLLILIIFLIVIFMYAYKKQTKFIKDRVKIQEGKNEHD